MRVLKNQVQSPLSPSLMENRELVDTPRPSAGRFLHLFFSSLIITNSKNQTINEISYAASLAIFFVLGAAVIVPARTILLTFFVRRDLRLAAVLG